MIKVEQLYHSYSNNNNYAVKDINFAIDKGEIFGFLGPSGAGKSTTQKILTGLLQLQKGNVAIEGRDVRNPNADYFNKIGVSFEQANVYKKLTGLENLEFHAKMFSVPTNHPMELLKAVGLEEAAKKKAGDYSKGMLQRLVFARSMINNPKIWFLDEPTSGLDPTTAGKIKNIIRQKQQEGTTVFLTTHNMYIAEELCDRVAFIVDGEISVIDSPRNLKLKYGERLVKIDYRENDQIKSQMFSLTEEKDRQKMCNLLTGQNIETIHSQEATLEEIFIKLTGRGLE